MYFLFFTVRYQREQKIFHFLCGDSGQFPPKPSAVGHGVAPERKRSLVLVTVAKVVERYPATGTKLNSRHYNNILSGIREAKEWKNSVNGKTECPD